MSQNPKTYSHGTITISWEPELCVHSGICARGLPDVFKPRERPWIHADAASEDAILEQVARCPSKALKAWKNAESGPSEPEN